jgi:AcrR family transcriptional regulator
MCPRPYRLGRRQAAAEKTRARIIAAARELLTASAGFTTFTVDGVADRAGVARMTVYYQFGSKVGLLEALCDSLALAGGLDQLAGAFRRPDPLDALADFVGIFCRFYDSERLLARRLHGLAALDPDFEKVLQGRQGRRREGLRVLVGRLTAARRRTARALEEMIDVLHTLTRFETFDALAGTTRGARQVAAVIYRLARAALDLDAE